MLDTARIQDIARDVALARVAKADLERIVAMPMTDSTGHDALRITVVLAPGAARRVTGDVALDVLSSLQQQLQIAGEDRFAFIDYATEEELHADAGADEA
ncbi:hypothetical protein Q8W71_07735 [Methylobacterium sp. NEAU 140]|uniref:hypothetical protein n=1 Tax=Methylobacterium sp. NEAU 140 TaxID=3064945 RepID=UPI0027363D5C|nr:hypothetical protein [Methylobacterium sp. NEAU 140]MDP4022509.1 hypothetical protein [Methylobacterium sp. NEAU 140]